MQVQRNGKVDRSVTKKKMKTKLESRAIFKKLLKESKLCVLATASKDGKPEAAVIEYAADENDGIYFETFPDYRKYPNLINNPRASIVITKEPNTIQMDGVVEEQKDKCTQDAKRHLIAKHGKGSGFYNDPNIRFFKFTQTWIRILISDKWPPKYCMVKE